MSEKEDRVRVAHVIHGLPRGGLENGVVNLVNGLSGSGFEHIVYCLDDRGEMADRLLPNVQVEVFDRKRHDLNLPFRLAQRIRYFKPHVIHCRNWNTWMDAVLAHLISRSKASLLWSFHGFEGDGNYPFRRRFASQMLARKTDRMMAVCKDAALRYSSKTGLPPERFDVLYNGVDCSKFGPCQVSQDRQALRRKFGYSDKEVVILTVASLSEIKDHSCLLHAAATVMKATKNMPRFVFIGEGHERSALEQEIENLGLGNHVTMPGASDEVTDYLAAADIFVLPSKLEGMSNAILEAMASGLPVIAKAVGGNVELVDSGETGILTAPESTEAMAQAIIQLTENEPIRRDMGDKGRQRAVNVFSIEAMLDRYREYYQNLADCQGKRYQAESDKSSQYE